jgi:hypothetical protein
VIKGEFMSNSISMLMLDLPTVLFLYSTSLIAGTCAVLNVWRHQRNETGLGLIALALAVLAVGGAGGAERAALLPWPFLWRYVHFVLGVGGYAALWSGLAELSSRAGAPGGCAFDSLLWLAGGILSGFILHNGSGRQCFISMPLPSCWPRQAAYGMTVIRSRWLPDAC